MIKTAVVGAVGGFALAILLVPIIRKLCARWKLYDWPGPLKVHTKPIPRLGGIAITLAILGGTVLSIRFSAAELPFFAALLLICLVGVVDDISGLSAVIRLAAQFVAGGILWYGGGRFVSFGGGVLGLVVTSLLTIAIINSFNFLDGADGLASGVAGTIAIVYAAFPWRAGDQLGPAIAWSLAGSCAGFLFFNFPPAKIFLGDCGSTVVGLCVAFLICDLCRSPSATGPRLFFPLVVAALPLLDASLAIVRRIRARVSPLYGDRRHFCDLLGLRGSSPRVVAFECYGITALFGVIGLMGERFSPTGFLVLAHLGIGALFVAALRLGALQQNAKTWERKKAIAELDQSRETG